MMNLDKTTIAKVICEKRKSLGLSQAQLAEKLGISDKHISKIETGKYYPSLDNFMKILTTLNLTLGDFGVNNVTNDCEAKEYMLKLANTLSKKQLAACKDVLESLLKHV